MLPPLPQMKPLPPPLPVLTITHIKRASSVGTGDGFVQVLLDAPDDASARLMMVAEGVRFIGASLVPETGTLFSTAAPGGKIRYCWRA